MPNPDQMRKAAPPPVAPEMQDAVDKAAKDLATPKAATVPNATQAGTLGLAGSDAPVNPTDAEIYRATNPDDPATSRGGIPAPSNKDVQPPLVVPPTGDVKPTPTAITPPSSVIASKKDQPPTTKEMIAKVLATGAGGVNSTPQEGKFNFADLVKGAGGKLGDFLQRWGMGLQGAPTGQTQGDIQRAQQFELQKQQAQANVMVRQQALANAYETQRMQLQNQMNVANIPIEAKAQLQSRLAELDAQYQNEIKLLPMRIQQERAIRGMAPGADPGSHFVGGQ